MKKTKFVLALFSLPLLLTSCGGKGSDNSLENNIFTEAASWTNDQLLEKAKATEKSKKKVKIVKEPDWTLFEVF